MEAALLVSTDGYVCPYSVEKRMTSSADIDTTSATSRLQFLPKAC